MRVLKLLLPVTILCAFGMGWPYASATALQWGPLTTDAENDAIRYSTSTSFDAIARLQQQIDAGTTTLRFDATHGYLSSVLRELKVPVASQMLVFSKTSVQRERISPATPRAVYFNRDVYVGWVPGGTALEIASIDPNLGAVFYTLDQEQAAHPTFQRQTRKCLECHDSPSLTNGVPGLIVKSVHADSNGDPIASAGTFATTDRSPLNERWGGWYVTGTHGAQLHMGNVSAERGAKDVRLNLAAGANLTDLRSRIDVRRYLAQHSDIAALLVLEHQTHTHNLITLTAYRTRMALFFDRMRNEELRRGADDISDSTLDVIRNLAEPLIRTMLFVQAAPFVEPIAGTSGFAEQFSVQGPRDRRGRSLLQLDLTRRLLRYPCSYLIYSASFDALPAPAREYVYRRLWEVLSGEDTSEAFAHLSRADRTAILEILLDTKPAFRIVRKESADAR